MANIRGRRPIRHQAISEFERERVLPSALRAFKGAVDEWTTGGSYDAVMAALDTLREAVGTLPARSEFDKELSRADRFAWSALSYLEAVTAVEQIDVARAQASGIRDRLWAQLLADAATTPPLPRYAESFAKGLMAENLGQHEMHPPTRRKMRAVATALRNLDSDDAEDVPLPRPPIRRWDQLPRVIAGFKLVENAPIDDTNVPTPLPPTTDIADLVDDPSGLERGTLDDAVFDRYLNEIRIATMLKGIRLDGVQARHWLLLLGHRCQAADDQPRQMDTMGTMVSPWNPNEAVAIEWIGSDEPK